DPRMRVSDLRFDSSVALHWQPNAAGGFYLAGNLSDEFGAPRDERDLVARGEARRESRAQAGPYSYDCCYAFFVFRCHRITPVPVSLNRRDRTHRIRVSLGRTRAHRIRGAQPHRDI